MGHMSEAAGIGGLIKAVLAMKNGVIPPHAAFKMPNNRINFMNSPVYVNTRARKWEADIKRCGISAFGMSGTNCHVIIEEAPKTDNANRNRNKGGLNILTISAKNDSSFKIMVKRFFESAQNIGDDALRDFYTAIQEEDILILGWLC